MDTKDVPEWVMWAQGRSSMEKDQCGPRWWLLLQRQSLEQKPLSNKQELHESAEQPTMTLTRKK